MKLKMQFGVLCVLGVMILCYSLNGQQESKIDNASIEAAILNTYDEIMVVAEKVDVDKMFDYVLENDKGCLVSDGKLVMTRQAAIDNYRNNSRNIASVDYIMDKKLVTVVSAETAIMAAEGRYELTTVNGDKFGSPMAQSIIFVLKDGQWKVLHSHTSLPNP